MLKIKYRNGVIDNFPRKASDMRWTLNEAKFTPDFDVAFWKHWED